MRPPKPKPKKVTLGLDSSKMSKALQKPKLLTGNSKSTEKMKKNSSKTTIGTGRIKITGSATGTKTPTAAQVNAKTKNGMKINRRVGSK